MVETWKQEMPEFVDVLERRTTTDEVFDRLHEEIVTMELLEQEQLVKREQEYALDILLDLFFFLSD